jgi:5'-deoxynucleotidase YfbR-like HD superfamily hydrolase
MMDTVRRIVGPTILLHSGCYFDFEAPETSAFTIEDIAHALSMICRFGGHCIRHYSVAQHSVHVSDNLPYEHSYQGLMHDAPEFAVGDMVKPLKDQIDQYRLVEKRVEDAVFLRFNVAPQMHQSVKNADMRMLATEQRQLMGNYDNWSGTLDAFDFKIPVWSPGQAKSRFLKRFYDLTKVRNSCEEKE